MRQLVQLFGGLAGLAVAGAVAILIFTLLGGLMIAAGLVLTGVLVAGGLYALVTGRRAFSAARGPFGTAWGPFGTVRIFEVREGASDEREMIDVTPPKDRRKP